MWVCAVFQYAKTFTPKFKSAPPPEQIAQEFADMLGVATDDATVILPKDSGPSSSQINAMAYVEIFSSDTW